MIEVTASDRTYKVEMNSGSKNQYLNERRFVVVVPREMRSIFEKAEPKLFKNASLIIEVPDGESQKSIKTVEAIWDEFGRNEIGRDALIVGIGGGATTDLAGFLAATWLRGIEWLAIPTTLAGMVDASIGGKTGINSASGKNLIGAFHSPIFVDIQTSFLQTLPERDFRAGMAEVIKCGFIADPEILHILKGLSGPNLFSEQQAIEELITRSVQVKSDIVSQDFRESGIREYLNYGHTLGHAIERVNDYLDRHGEAVSVGLVFAAELSRLHGKLNSDMVNQHRHLLEKFLLPVSTHFPFAELMQAMKVDKKIRNGLLRMVLLEEIGKPYVQSNISEAMLRAAFDKVAS